MIRVEEFKNPIEIGFSRIYAEFVRDKRNIFRPYYDAHRNRGTQSRHDDARNRYAPIDRYGATDAPHGTLGDFI